MLVLVLLLLLVVVVLVVVVFVFVCVCLCVCVCLLVCVCACGFLAEESYGVCCLRVAAKDHVPFWRLFCMAYRQQSDEDL